MKKDEFKINIFFDENGPTFEELVMEAFEERLNEILDKYYSKNNSTLSNIDKNNTEKVEN
ncbi:MAG: hypothetical protein IJE04_05805 [Bacilli bacterium]|nr:hypothetical protein [Bacilli bacterium]